MATLRTLLTVSLLCLTASVYAGDAQKEPPFSFPPEFSAWIEAERGVIDSMPEGFRLLGRLNTRHAQEIGHSLFSIGGETQDRDFTNFDAWKHYLGPLGAKRVRIQSGWAKTEKRKGEYDFAWLDNMVDGSLERGVRPWISLSYGNPIYPGGGGTGLGGGLIESDEALEAWDRYIRATIRNFRDRVAIYEVWNEADHGANKSKRGQYARLYERTARIIREEQPNATILALALAGLHTGEDSAIVDFVETLKERDELHLVDGVTLHGYPHNPDNGLQYVAEIRSYLDRHIPHAVIWQGETGAPSERGTQFALRNLDWSELTQAKWDLRRALAYWSRDIPFSLFSISEMNYSQKERFNTLNTKGKLKIRPEDLSIERPKISYFSYRHICSVFADSLQPQRNAPEVVSDSGSVYAFAVEDLLHGAAGLVFWDRGSPPAESVEAQSVSLHAGPLRISSPVIVDLLTGLVFEVPQSSISRHGNDFLLTNMPLWDSPRIFCDRSLVSWREIEQ